MDGWFLDHTRGSHRQYKHLIKRGLVAVAGTQRSILKQAQLV